MKALEYGFRPADPSIPLSAPLDSQHGIDITQPKTILEIPSAAVIDKIQALWRETKKPVDQIILFSSEISTLTPLSPLGPKRQGVLDSVSGIFETGETRLYDATLAAYQDLTENSDPDHIRAIVVLSDGQDTASAQSLDQVMAQIDASASQGGNAIKIFTIAFGDGADTSVLKSITEPTGGKQYNSSPENIQKIYDEIAMFF